MEPFHIAYIPIPGVPITHRKTLLGTKEMIWGFVLMASQISDNFVVTLSSGDVVDIPAALSTKMDDLPYHSSLVDLPVQFESTQFLDGAIAAAHLFGVSTKLISSVMLLPVEVDVAHYSIEDVEHVDALRLLLPAIYPSLAASLKECFESDNIGLYDPTVLTVALQPHVIATSAATPQLDMLPEAYHNTGGWYIYNVCAGRAYRGRGHTKAVLIAQINYLVAMGVSIFFLEVYPDNLAAIGLYTGLGFVRLETSGIADIYYLSVDFSEP